MVSPTVSHVTLQTRLSNTTADTFKHHLHSCPHLTMKLLQIKLLTITVNEFRKSTSIWKNYRNSTMSAI